MINKKIFSKSFVEKLEKNEIYKIKKIFEKVKKQKNIRMSKKLQMIYAN